METKSEMAIEALFPDRIEAGKEIEFFKFLDEALDVGVAILDENMTYRYMGQGMLEQLGLPIGTIKVGDHLSVCHEAMLKHKIIEEKVVKSDLISPEKNKSGEVEKNPDGIHDFLDGRRIQLVRKKLPNGYLISMAYDVTSLLEKDDMLEVALRLGNAGYWTYNFKTKEYTLNRSLRDYFKAENIDKIKREGFLHTLHPDDRYKFRHALTNAPKNGDRFDVTCQMSTQHGQERYSRATGKIERDPAGKPTLLRVFVKDVTRERHQAAALERAKDEAIAASHAKSEFLANMSHEIRTPMNGVLGMAELLANTDIDERQREFVNVINDSASALLTIINDILDFSKIEAGALELDPVSFDLADTIGDVASLLSIKAKEKNLEIIVNYPSDLPHMFNADAGRIRQVLTNLVSNAVKFTDEGHILINVEASAPARASDKTMVTVTVTDTGIGIESHKIENIFEKFTQADGSTTRVYGGTGLGLSISKKIVELMNGRMNVTSIFGEGSKFCFSIPLQLDKSRNSPAIDTTEAAGKRVLIIDDIEVNRSILTQQTESWGMIATSCENGIEGLKCLRDAAEKNSPYDLILLDYLMPGMNGEEFAYMANANPKFDTPPILMLSSCDQPLSSDVLSKIGVVSFLMKPVRENRLYKTIIKELSKPPAKLPSMPQLASAPPADRAAASAPTPPKTALPSYSKAEILVAEDFKLNQDVVRLMLADSPFQPIFANNGKEAVDMFIAEPDRFPLVLMDISMPVMDGYEATSQINTFNENNGRPHTPIIALTGHALKYDRENCLDAGMDDYLVKPVQQGKLLALLEYYFTNNDARAANA
jgi:signal transduction histidine kinase/DNA-binding response OmpR family regulator